MTFIYYGLLEMYWLCPIIFNFWCPFNRLCFTNRRNIIQNVPFIVSLTANYIILQWSSAGPLNKHSEIYVAIQYTFSNNSDFQIMVFPIWCRGVSNYFKNYWITYIFHFSNSLIVYFNVNENKSSSETSTIQKWI